MIACAGEWEVEEVVLEKACRSSAHQHRQHDGLLKLHLVWDEICSSSKGHSVVLERSVLGLASHQSQGMSKHARALRHIGDALTDLDAFAGKIAAKDSWSAFDKESEGLYFTVDWVDGHRVWLMTRTWLWPGLPISAAPTLIFWPVPRI